MLFLASFVHSVKILTQVIFAGYTLPPFFQTILTECNIRAPVAKQNIVCLQGPFQNFSLEGVAQIYRVNLTSDRAMTITSCCIYMRTVNAERNLNLLQGVTKIWQTN